LVFPNEAQRFCVWLVALVSN